MRQVATMMTRLFSSMIFIKGYVHCDPHPGNVLVEKVNGRPQLILLDHGLYRDLDEEFRYTDGLVGWLGVAVGPVRGR